MTRQLWSPADGRCHGDHAMLARRSANGPPPWLVVDHMCPVCGTLCTHVMCCPRGARDHQEAATRRERSSELLRCWPTRASAHTRGHYPTSPREHPAILLQYLHASTPEQPARTAGGLLQLPDLAPRRRGGGGRAGEQQRSLWVASIAE
eukprot:scaffold34989_cov118-Isochrysis_galbana.AAC.1